MIGVRVAGRTGGWIALWIAQDGEFPSSIGVTLDISVKEAELLREQLDRAIAAIKGDK